MTREDKRHLEEQLRNILEARLPNRYISEELVQDLIELFTNQNV